MTDREGGKLLFGPYYPAPLNRGNRPDCLFGFSLRRPTSAAIMPGKRSERAERGDGAMPMAAITVKCAHCHKTFTAEPHDEVIHYSRDSEGKVIYVVRCTHCGKDNRVRVGG
jgi:phage FluMu protein Com